MRKKDYTILFPKPGMSFEAIQGLDFHQILKNARLKKNIGVRELSRQVGCSHVFLLKVEAGEKCPSPRLLDALQRELGLDPFFVVPTKDIGSVHNEMVSAINGDEWSPPREEILVALLLTALRQGRFKPVPIEPTREEKKDGIVASIALNPAGTLVLSIKSTDPTKFGPRIFKPI
jgi:transcriptional regulator with XRE-family HTH domain